MPRVKIDYVVSFSSEDPEHQANNLLNREVSKKKWLCQKGEPSCSVVLQLAKAVKISAVHIGAYHAALVEVLVARSETSSDQFQVLVPRSVFVSREESRRDAAAERVRSFSGDQLSAPASAQRWDRVRLVCSQPYNKHCKYGLSFVHIDESEGSSAASVPPRLFALDTFSSDEEEFKPGELFAKHLQKTSGDNQINTAPSTGAQIRQATSQALKNISESSTKLMKTPITKPSSSKREDTAGTERTADRGRDTLLYTDDDQRPHAKIDHVVQRHKHERERDDNNKHTAKHDKRDKDRHDDNTPKPKDERSKRTPKRTISDSPTRTDIPQSRLNKDMDKPGPSDQKRDDSVRKRRRSRSQDKEPDRDSVEPHELLRGVVLVLSGYENPRRSQIRNLALAMGARVERDWGPSCTHLICAFPNTPKLRAVRSSAGAHVPAARAAWLDACRRRRRRLPAGWYATEPEHYVKPKPEDLAEPASEPDARRRRRSDSDPDTDDEIQRVLRDNKKRRLTEDNSRDDQRDDTPSPTTSTNDEGRRRTEDSERSHTSTIDNEHSHTSPKDHERDYTRPKDNEDNRTRTKGEDDHPRTKDDNDMYCDTKGTDESETDTKDTCPEYEASTDDESGAAPPPRPFARALPHFLRGTTFAITSARSAPARLLARYVRAYGGLVLEMSAVEEGSHVDYVVRCGEGEREGEVAAFGAGGGGGAALVTGAWLARCVAARALLPT